MALNIVLFEPEIVENIGNIARTCVAFNAKLHLIRPYGCLLSANKLKRSSAGHLDDCLIFEYDDFTHFFNSNINDQVSFFGFSRYGQPINDKFNFKFDLDKEVYVIFGKESSGLSKDIMNLLIDNLIRIPTSFNMRSINLSNSVAICCYKYAELSNFNNLCLIEPHKQKE